VEINNGSKMQFYYFKSVSARTVHLLRQRKLVSVIVIVKEVRELKFSHNKEPSCQGKQDRPPIAISGKSPITPNQNCGLWETMEKLI
jgi:hypothetical protein